MKERDLQVRAGAHRNAGATGSSWRERLWTRPAGTNPHIPEGRIWLAAGLLAVVLLLSVVVTLIDTRLRFTIYSTTTEVGLESASALARLFAALVLFLFPWKRGGNRLLWVAAGLGVLGIGGLIFGFMAPLFNLQLSFNSSTYASGAIRTLATLLLVIGLAPRQPPRFARAWTLATVLGLIIVPVIAGP